MQTKPAVSGINPQLGGAWLQAFTSSIMSILQSKDGADNLDEKKINTILNKAEFIADNAMRRATIKMDALLAENQQQNQAGEHDAPEGAQPLQLITEE